MASISASGIARAAPTTGTDTSIGPVHRFVRRLSAALIVVGLLPGAAPAEQHPSAPAAAISAEQTPQSRVTML